MLLSAKNYSKSKNWNLKKNHMIANDYNPNPKKVTNDDDDFLNSDYPEPDNDDKEIVVRYFERKITVKRKYKNGIRY